MWTGTAHRKLFQEMLCMTILTVLWIRNDFFRIRILLFYWFRIRIRVLHDFFLIFLPKISEEAQIRVLTISPNDILKNKMIKKRLTIWGLNTGPLKEHYYKKLDMAAVDKTHAMDEGTIKTQNPKCRLYWCLLLWTSAPLTFSLVHLTPSLPYQSKSTVYTESVWMWGGGEVLSCVVDHILQELNTLFLRFRTYIIDTPPPTKKPVKTTLRDWCLYSSSVHDSCATSKELRKLAWRHREWAWLTDCWSRCWNHLSGQAVKNACPSEVRYSVIIDVISAGDPDPKSDAFLIPGSGIRDW